uniref:Uncharacterized protein n=1 Tax=viral metagenome TaxID=1070528 RepID=A0A6M3LAY2_9ZZZZ
MAEARQSPQIQPDPVIVTKESQLRQGTFYMLRGTVSNTDRPESDRRRRLMDDTIRLPPTIIMPASPIYRSDTLGVGHFRAWMCVALGEWKAHEYVTVIGLEQINVPPHGAHDHHLARIGTDIYEAMGALLGENRRDDYGEMVGYRRGRYG